MFLLTTFILINRIQAHPIPTLDLDQSSSSHDTRSIWNIVWSSLVTLFACIWVAVHPNIRSPTDGIRTRVRERVKLLLAAVIAPEIIIMFAMRQWVCARDVMRSAFGRERGWTHTHGFFLAMGGFVLYDSEGERLLYPLDLENIESLVQRGAIDFPKITEEEIKDKSKGDIISKGLAIIQTGWFIMQCIARGAEHLAITELEIMTVAFAFLNLITYIFWWNKPLNVTCPIRIVLKEGHSVPEPRPRQRVSFWNRVYRMITLIYPDRDDETDLLREKRVPTFYAGTIVSESTSWYTLLTMEILVAMIFGGIHCIAWSFSFPTHVEQILWRASSIAIISIPILWEGTIAFVYFDLLDGGTAFGMLTTLLSFIYPAARVVLLILSFISLRSLPPSAFYTVRWITFVPHVG